MTRLLRCARWSLGGLAALVILATATGTLLPAEAHVPDTVATLKATPAELFQLFNSRAGQRRVWASSGMSLTPLGGGDEGVGSRTCFCYTGLRGEGVIVESQQNRRVVYHIDFGFTAVHRTIDLEPITPDTARVVWQETLIAPNILMRWVLLGSSAIPGFQSVLDAAEAAVQEDPCGQFIRTCCRPVVSGCRRGLGSAHCCRRY